MQNISALVSKYIIYLLIICIIPILIPLTKPGFFPTQDYIYVARVYEMNKALLDGQFPVRWVPDFRYGEPLYNFYAPLPYYIGAIVKNFGFTYLVTVKILFALGFILSGITMFLLGQKLFGKLGGFLTAILYTYAPYHAVDVYVRGALSESWALMFFPLIFLTSLNLSEKVTLKNVLFLTLSLAGLFYTHNIMTILFAPFFALWCGFLIYQKRNIKFVKYLLFAFLLGVGLAASFLLPAFFEKDLVQSNKLITGYFDFRGHFVAIPQFFSTFWGYGASLWGSKDDMSFQVGISLWVFIGLGLIFTLILKSKKWIWLTGFLMLEFLFSLFMQHNQSAPIWEKFSLLAFTQFPWRFLGISIFFASLIGGVIGLYLAGNKKLAWVSVILVVGIIALNINYFRPESFYLDSIDDHYVSSKTLSIDDKLPKDYLPIWVRSIADKKYEPYAVAGKMTVSEFKKRSAAASFKVNVLESGEVEVPITYFPGWTAQVDGKVVKIEDPSNLGLVKIKVNKGTHTINLHFGNTPVRNIGNIISLVSLIIIAGIFFKKIKHE